VVAIIKRPAAMMSLAFNLIAFRRVFHNSIPVARYQAPTP